MSALKSFETTVDLIELDGSLIDLECSVERACCMMQDITEAYLTGCKLKKEDEALFLLGYNEFSIKAQIAYDYLLKIASMTAEARNKFEQMIDSCRADVAKGA